MASFLVDAHGARPKVRDVGIVVLLTFVTIGIYNLFWYFWINRELRDFGRVYQDEYLSKEKPWLSLLAVTIGWILIVPPIVSYYRTTARVRQVERIAEAPLTSGWVVFGLAVASFLLAFGALVVPAYIQSELNTVWQKFPKWDPEPPAPPAAGEPAEATPQIARED